MREYMGVVFDIGHQSVGYEDIPASLQKLVDAGVPDRQAAGSGVDVTCPDVTQETVDALQAVRQDDLPVADLPAEGRQDARGS